MKLKSIILAAVFLVSPALADTALIFNTIGNNVAGPNPIVIMMPMHMDENHNVFMMANVIDPDGVKSVTIIGNGKTLATCQSAICNYVWARTSMRSGQNTVILQYVNSAGVQRQASGYVNKPAAL